MTTLTELRKLAEAATPIGPYADPPMAAHMALVAALSPPVVLAMLDERDRMLSVIDAAKAMREAGVDLSRRCIEPPYMSEKAAVNEMIGIFDGPLQRSFDAALAEFEKERGR